MHHFALARPLQHAIRFAQNRRDTREAELLIAAREEFVERRRLGALGHDSERVRTEPSSLNNRKEVLMLLGTK